MTHHIKGLYDKLGVNELLTINLKGDSAITLSKYDSLKFERTVDGGFLAIIDIRTTGQLLQVPIHNIGYWYTTRTDIEVKSSTDNMFKS